MSIESTNTQFKAVITNKTGLQSTAVSDGCVYFVDDTKELFFDFDSTRVEVKDILILDTDAQRTNILFNPLNKFYFVLETQKLWLYRNGVWYQISGSVDLSNYYTKSEVEELIPEVPTNLSDFIDDLGSSPIHTHSQYLTEHQDLNGYQLKITSTNKLSADLLSEGSTNKLVSATEKSTWNEKANKATTLSGYGITDAYTKTEVDDKLSSVYKFKGTIESIDSLPTSGNVIGDVYNLEDTGANYAWTGTGWDKLSETIDLSGYATKTELDDKVDKVIGKGLSTNDYTTEEKQKLAGLSNTIIDSELSTTSTNPVQNKVITQALRDIDIDSLIPVTYAELVELKTNSQLKEGAFYRITDYVTTTNGICAWYIIESTSRSAGHQFDIIIQALGTSDLSDIGTCAIHEGDTYFANDNLGAWQIWYDIENDTNKYEWADATNGKGVIYRMIDDNNIDCPYDFKNMQFSRVASNYPEISSYLTANDNYYYTFSIINNGVSEDYTTVGIKPRCADNFIGFQGNFNTGLKSLNNIVIICDSTNYWNNNNIGNGLYELTTVNRFNSNIFLGGDSYNNILSNFAHNEVGTYFNRNKIIGSTSTNSYNILGNRFYSNSLTSGVFGYNTTDFSCHDNTMSGTVTNNIIGQNFYSNTISSTNFSNNRIGNVVYSNTFTGGNIRKNFIVGDCYNNTFNTFYLNFIGYYFAGNTVGANFGYNTVLDTVSGNTFGTGCQGNVLLGYDAYISFPNSCRALVVGRFVTGSSATNKLDLTGIPAFASYQITILLDVNNCPVAKWQDNNIEVGLYKTSLTASTWSNLVTTLTLEDWDV